MRFRLTPFLVAALAPVAQAQAQTCDATFTKKGNPVTGLKFTAMNSVADLSTRDAINQLRGIVVARGYDVLASEPDAGDMLLEMPQAANQRSFPIVAKATAAQQGERATTGAAPTVMNAQMLADRLSTERDRNVNEIPLRYKDRAFSLEGMVSSVIRDGDSYSVVFDILPWEKQAVQLPGESQFKTDIVCRLAPGQSVYALTLKPRTTVTLTGTYQEYRELPLPSTMWLADCTSSK